MNDIKKTLDAWLNELANFKFPDYEKFPDIDLYMDQVVTYLERNLSVLSTSSLDKIITSSMINNYVKGEVITAPIAKKYNKEHLALLEQTCSLKQVLSIAEIKQVLDIEYKDKDKSKAFNEFKELHSTEFEKVIDECSDYLKDISNGNDIDALTSLVLALSVSANAKITVAKRILFYIMKHENAKKELEDKHKNEIERQKKEEERLKKEEEKIRKEEERLAQVKIAKGLSIPENQ